MAHSDDHPTHRDPRAEGMNRQPLILALAITFTVMLVEIAGGLLTGSLALLADAGHMATDAAALALALGAVWLARRSATPARSFGFYRAEVLAALVNAATLVAISLYIFWEAFARLGDPPEVESGPMLVVAVVGLLANAASAWVLMRDGGHEHNLNMRGVFLHVIGDMLGSVGAIMAALVMMATGWYLADPILSAGIGALILWSSWRLLCESVNVLLESAPRQVDVEAVRSAMRDVDGVAGVHDLHIWTVTSGVVALSSHIEISRAPDWHAVLRILTRLIQTRFAIAHVTLQPEESRHGADAFRGCCLDVSDGLRACRVPRADLRSPHVLHGHPIDACLHPIRVLSLSVKPQG